MKIGFVYILLNPAFPDLIKIGRTNRDSNTRALELSRQTAAPDDFIVLYDELVSDSKQVEELLHSQFCAYRFKRNKEFFRIPPKEAIKALQSLAIEYSIPPSTPSLKTNLLPHFKQYFSKYIDDSIEAINLVLQPNVCYLEVSRRFQPHLPLITENEDIPLEGIREPEEPNTNDLKENEILLKSCDAYDWIMISDLFTADKCNEIAIEWEKPGGKLELIRSRNKD